MNQEKLYDKLITASIECESLVEVNELISIFESNKWNDTNYRMLEYSLGEKLKYLKAKANVVKKVIIAEGILKEQKNFLSISVN